MKVLGSVSVETRDTPNAITSNRTGTSEVGKCLVTAIPLVCSSVRTFGQTVPDGYAAGACSATTTPLCEEP